MRLDLHAIYGPYLTRPQRAIDLCARILEQNEPVMLDFSEIVQMSPSFVNALFLNLLHRMPVDQLCERVHIAHAEPYLMDAINSAINRKMQNQIELSSYQLA